MTASRHLCYRAAVPTRVNETGPAAPASQPPREGTFLFLSDLLGLDTVLHVAEHLERSYGERFYVHPQMKELVEAGKLGQKTGEGYYQHGG